MSQLIFVDKSALGLEYACKGGTCPYACQLQGVSVGAIGFVTIPGN